MINLPETGHEFQVSTARQLNFKLMSSTDAYSVGLAFQLTTFFEALYCRSENELI